MKRWQFVVIAVIAVLGAAILVSYRLGVRLLQDKVVVALGPNSHLTELKVNWFTVELLGVTIDAPKGWPAARTFEAKRVTIVPDLRTLFTQHIRIASIVIEKPYLSVLRNPGKLVMIPSLTEREKKAQPDQESTRAVTISRIELRSGRLDLYDATIARVPYKTRIEEIAAVIKDITVPARNKTYFDLNGVVKGVGRDGRATVRGWVGPAARDSSSDISLDAVDLVALQPYLVKKTDARVAKGTLDLKLGTEVRNNNLAGRGKLTLRDLTFAPSADLFDTFMGLPRNAVISFLKDHNDAIDVDFILTGNTNNPNFSLNENLSTRIATAMAGQLGISITNVAEGLGSLGRKGIEGAGSVVEGVGSAVKQLFGGSGN